MQAAVLAGKLAILATALFAGAAAYITLVEHPARMLCPTGCALAQWRPSYRRATAMQVPLAMAGTLAAILAWLGGAGPGWLFAGLLLGAVVPFTLIAVLPTNRRLEGAAPDASDGAARLLLARWGRLHAVRSGASLAALALMLALV